MQIRKEIKILLSLLFIIIVQSCGVLWVRKNDPKAKFCKFDTHSKTIYCKSESGGIKRLCVFLYNKDSTIWILKNKIVEQPIKVFNLSNELQSYQDKLTTTYALHIQIWNNSPVLYDYYIEVKPTDWNAAKQVVGRWNAR